MAFELLGAFPPRDQLLAAQVGITVIENDMPRPHRPAVDVQAYLAAQRVPPNGHKKPAPVVTEDDGQGSLF
jgi:hypothetical protein